MSSAHDATKDADRAVAAGEARHWPVRYTLIALCFAAVFICYIDRVNISVAALSMQDALGWSETVKGFVLSSFFIGYLLFQIPSGYLTKRFGGKRVLGFAVVWWSLCTVLTPAAAAISLPALIASRIAMGLGEAAMFPATYGLFARWLPATARSRGISLMQSGIPLGTLFALGATGWIIARFDWPAVFYGFGALGFVWALVWFARVHDDPAQHPRISPHERRLLIEADELAPGAAPPLAGVPWKVLLTAPAVWALIVNHFCSTWTLYMLLAWLPSYFSDAQGLDITGAGLFSAAPWLTMFVMLNAGAWIADGMINRGVSLTAVRKIMQVTGLLGSAAFLLATRGAAEPSSAQLLLCGAMGALALCWSGFATNHLDIAPRYAGVLMGLTNTVGTLPGIIGIAVTGWLVETSGTYSSAFVLAAAVSIFGAVVWLALGTGKRVLP